MYTVYAIIDPVRNEFVYIGETNNFNRRKKEHLGWAYKQRPKIKVQNIKTWLWDQLHKGIVPEFKILKVVSSREESLKEETDQIRIYSLCKHALLNRRRIHRLIIKEFYPSSKRAFPEALLNIRDQQDMLY